MNELNTNNIITKTNNMKTKPAYTQKETQELECILLLKNRSFEKKLAIIKFCNNYNRAKKSVYLKLFHMKKDNINNAINSKQKSNRILIPSNIDNPIAPSGCKTIIINIKFIDILDGKLIIHY